jgi:methylaspartate ammonia-lyase
VVDDDYVWLLGVDILATDNLTAKDTEHSIGDKLANEVNDNAALIEWIADEKCNPREQIEHKTDNCYCDVVE